MIQLIEGIKNKDQKAFREIYKMFSVPMFNTAIRIVGSEVEAEDVLQEVFIKVFQHVEKLEKAELFPAWIKRITINTSLELINKKKLLKVEELSVNFDSQEEEERIDELQFAYKVEELQKAIFELPEIYRVVFTLHCMEEMSHEDIAKQFNIPAATVRSQYARAKKKINELISKEPKNERQSKRIYTFASISI